MLRVWEGALAILNADDRDWKQILPQDLESNEYNGRQIIKSLMNNISGSGSTFINIARVFLLVFTHSALLDCLSVDTFVGSLYTFIGGANGKRAIPYFQHLCEILAGSIGSTSTTVLETTLMATSTALRELLRREAPARFHNDLPDLINTLETTAEMITENTSVTFHMVQTHIADLRAMVSHAGSLLLDDAEIQTGTILPTPKSTYPRNFVMPRNRYDNDKADITEMKIFPTREEILSDEIEFLPSTDRDQPHFLEDQAKRLIDTHFRLFRHDTFGNMKSALARLMNSISQDSSSLLNPKASLGDLQAYPYINAHINYVTYNRQHRDLEITLSFPQPPQVRRRSEADRRRWWEESKRLEEGTLLSFMLLENGKIQHLFFTVSGRSTDAKKDHSLTKDASQTYVTAKVAMKDQASIEAIIMSSCQKTKGVLVEFPNVMPATFIPILENLQNMQRLSRLPFRQWILPEKAKQDDDKFLHIPPPLYARVPSFSFPLDSITKNSKTSLSISSTASVDDASLLDNIEKQTGLDHGQSQALIAALTREFAFIQGPPGTGKSYLGVQLMKVFLALKSKAKLGPVIVVCYTNHALDQFLEHLLQVGVSKIIRIGGQSRSELLEGHNLREISRTELKTKAEGYLLAKNYEHVEEIEKSIKSNLGRVHAMRKRLDWRYFEQYLRENHPTIHRQFNQVDEDGFEMVGRHPFEIWRTDDAMAATLGSQAHPPLSLAETRDLVARATTSVYSLSNRERLLLLDTWVQKIQSQASDAIYEDVRSADSTQKHIHDIHEEVNRRILQDADVIGITTTGLAQRIALLQRIRSKVVICEEAGEVLEAHMISTLLPSVEHFIQIGDHQQLRPKVDWSLSMESKRGALHQLDRSQFERLSVGEHGRPKVPVAQLNVQRRMRPQIAGLIRETIYPKLVDHISTLQLPDVIGMRRNVFWLHHDNPEEAKQAEIGHNRSKSNLWEVDMVHTLVRHMVRQGEYKSSEIAVLTPYTGQLQKLRAAMRSDFEIVLSDRDEDALMKDGLTSEDVTPDVDAGTVQDHKRKPLEKKKLADLLRLATVDNFQGEEAKIIIISLVRSNQDR